MYSAPALSLIHYFILRGPLPVFYALMPLTIIVKIHTHIIEILLTSVI